MLMTAADYVQHLAMHPHPEGGYFVETYHSAEIIAQSALPNRFRGPRSYSTAIYFLLEKGQRSALHRIQSDEVWHFYAGGPLSVFVIAPTGDLSVIRLGNRTDGAEVFQAMVPAGCWFGALPADDTNFSLVGCTVAPGFDFADFELADYTALSEAFPQHRAIIERLT